MYRTPEIRDATTRERGGRAPEREVAVLRRQHREHVAAERAKERALREAPQFGARGLTRPASAIWAFVSTRR
jgi:hypothetical protein